MGYTQSNFNSDNCLIGGVTVDFGPFGFIERYAPGWSMWVGSAEGTHFSFMNQPRAAGRNFRMFAQSLTPLLDAAGQRELRAVIGGYDAHAEAAMARMWASKLGLGAGRAPSQAPSQAPSLAAQAGAENPPINGVGGRQEGCTGSWRHSLSSGGAGRLIFAPARAA